MGVYVKHTWLKESRLTLLSSRNCRVSWTICVSPRAILTATLPFDSCRERQRPGKYRETLNMQFSVCLIDPHVYMAATDKNKKERSQTKNPLIDLNGTAVCVFSVGTEAEGHGNKSSGKEIKLHSTFATKKCNFLQCGAAINQRNTCRHIFLWSLKFTWSSQDSCFGEHWYRGTGYGVTYVVQNLAFCGVVFFSNGICDCTGAHKEGVPVVGAKKKYN